MTRGLTDVHGAIDAQEFSRIPRELAGTVESVTASAGYVEASMRLDEENLGAITVVLYSEPGGGVGLLTPAAGMWRGALLGLAQRALTHRQRVTLMATERRIDTVDVWVASNLTVHRP